MIVEVTKSERDNAIRQRKYFKEYYGKNSGRTFLKVRGKWYETTGASMRDIVAFQRQARNEALRLQTSQLSLL